MNHLQHPDFFDHTNDQHFFTSLTDEQKSGLDDFYHTHAALNRRELYQKYVMRNGQKVWTPNATIGRTAHHTYIALYGAANAHTTDDYELEAYRLDNALQREHYDIKNVENTNPNRRVIYAEGDTTHHKASIVIDMGRHILWVESFIINNHKLLLPLPIHPVKPSDIALPHHTQETSTSTNYARPTLLK